MPLVNRQLQFRGSSLRVMQEQQTASDVWDVLYTPATGEDARDAIYSAFTDWQLGQPSPSLPGFRCSAHTCDNGDSPVRYTVTVTYSIESGGTITDDPVLQPPQFDGEGEETQENVEEDLDGNAVVTTAGELMEPGTVTRAVSDFALVVTRNYPNIAGIVPYLAGFSNFVNSDNFLGGAPGTVLIRGVPRVTYVYPQEPLPDYWRVSWRFVYRDPWPSALTPPSNSAWFARVWNKGYQIDGASGLEYIRAADGAYATRPQFINVAGTAVTTTPNALWFRRYPARAFAPLGIVAP